MINPKSVSKLSTNVFLEIFYPRLPKQNCKNPSMIFSASLVRNSCQKCTELELLRSADFWTDFKIDGARSDLKIALYHCRLIPRDKNNVQSVYFQKDSIQNPKSGNFSEKLFFDWEHGQNTHMTIKVKEIRTEFLLKTVVFFQNGENSS